MDTVFRTGMRIFDAIGRACGGELPVTLDGLLNVIAPLDLDLEWTNSPGARTCKLVKDERGQYTVWCPARWPDRRKQVGIVHEIAEYLVLCEQLNLLEVPE